MAQEIVAPLFGHFIAGPGMVVKYADITAATRQVKEFGAGSSVGNPKAAKWIMLMVYQKAFTAGTGTVSVQYVVELANETGFTTGVVDVINLHLRRQDEAAGFGIGFSPLGARSFVGITRIANGTDAATYDAFIVGA